MLCIKGETGELKILQGSFSKLVLVYLIVTAPYSYTKIRNSFKSVAKQCS